jgi:hypothetical protein
LFAEERFAKAPKVRMDETTRTPSLKMLSDGMELRSDSFTFESARCTVPVSHGKWYFEVTLQTGGLFQIGWATKDTPFDYKACLSSCVW